VGEEAKLPMAVIEVNGLRKSYGDFEAVRGLSFTVAEGEVLAVLGPNGAGKTTTVEILEGYRTRDGGEVSVLGMDPERGGAELRRRIGIVLQECGIDRYLTVREILRMHAGYYDHPRDVDEVIELVGLGEKSEARVKQLSGGQQRRLDVGLGLVGDPELLFLDEPTTGFDPSARRQAWDVVRNLTALGKTVLLTTHYMDEAQTLADRIIVIAAGEIVAEGTPASIGGRGDAEATVSFQRPNGIGVDELPVPAQLDANGRVEIRSAHVTALLHELTGWALQRDLELRDLEVARPSLEDVYLELVGDIDRSGGAAAGLAADASVAR